MMEPNQSAQARTPEVTVVVVTFNSADVLAECLERVMDEASTCQIEIIVVDNNSQDDSVAIARSHATIEVLENSRNVGFASAVNQAILRSHGTYVLLLNPDATLCPGALGALVAFLDEHPRAAIVGPKIIDSGGRLVRSCRTFPSITTVVSHVTGLASRFPQHHVFGAESLTYWDYATDRLVDYASGACLLIRRAALDQVGLLDEAYFMYVEEMDLSWRMRDAGWQVWFTPSAIASHHGGRSASKVKQSHGYEPLLLHAYYSGQVRFWRRYRGELALLAWRVLTSGSSLIRVARLLPVAFAWRAKHRHDACRQLRRPLLVARLAWENETNQTSTDYSPAVVSKTDQSGER
jgi:hypothetical protein